MINATAYRKKHIIGTGKRVNFFINNELTKEEKKTLNIVRGRYNSGTFMNEEIFDKFKKWLHQDNRFRK